MIIGNFTQLKDSGWAKKQTLTPNVAIIIIKKDQKDYHPIGSISSELDHNQIRFKSQPYPKLWLLNSITETVVNPVFIHVLAFFVVS